MEGFVYFVRLGCAGPIKIGHAKDLKNRIDGLSTGSPYPLEVLATLHGTAQFERRLHRHLANTRARLEWFWPSAELTQIIDFARDGNVTAIIERVAQSEALASQRKALAKERQAQIRAGLIEAFRSATERYGLAAVAEVTGLTQDSVSQFARRGIIPSGPRIICMLRLDRDFFRSVLARLPASLGPGPRLPIYAYGAFALAIHEGVSHIRHIRGC
jgi:hypothetical protein